MVLTSSCGSWRRTRTRYTNAVDRALLGHTPSDGPTIDLARAQRAKESHDLQKKSGAVRSEALRKAEEMLKNAHSQAQAQTAAAQDKGRETIAKEHKRSRAVREKWEQEARSLLNDTAHVSVPPAPCLCTPSRRVSAHVLARAAPVPAPQAIKDLKAGQKESAKEIDDFRRSSERMVAALGTTHDKIVSSANTKIQGLLTKPPPIAGILAEINKMARAVQEDEEL